MLPGVPEAFVGVVALPPAGAELRSDCTELSVSLAEPLPMGGGTVCVSLTLSRSVTVALAGGASEKLPSLCGSSPGSLRASQATNDRVVAARAVRKRKGRFIGVGVREKIARVIYTQISGEWHR